MDGDVRDGPRPRRRLGPGSLARRRVASRPGLRRSRKREETRTVQARVRGLQAKVWRAGHGWLCEVARNTRFGRNRVGGTYIFQLYPCRFTTKNSHAEVGLAGETVGVEISTTG